jgi:AraC-like DNA-binding protein
MHEAPGSKAMAKCREFSTGRRAGGCRMDRSATDQVAKTETFEPKVLSFRTDDLDEAVDFVAQNFAPHSRVPRARGPLGYDACFSFAEHSACGTASIAVPSTLRAAARAVMVHLPLHPGAEYRVGRRRLWAAPDVAVLLCPGHDYSVDTPPGAALGLALDPSFLEREIDLLHVRRPRPWSLRSLQLPVSASEVAALRSIVDQHLTAASLTAERARRIADLGAAEQRMASWLARCVVAASGLVELSPSSREVVERVDAWIRANVAHPISLEQLRAVAGVSTRALQAACLARWGQTPVELVASRRLEAARSLLSSERMPTVTAAALLSGFSHLGRFSIAYRRAFGESPSDTLVRAAAVDATPARFRQRAPQDAAGRAATGG